MSQVPIGLPFTGRGDQRTRALVGSGTYTGIADTTDPVNPFYIDAGAGPDIRSRVTYRTPDSRRGLPSSLRGDASPGRPYPYAKYAFFTSPWGWVVVGVGILAIWYCCFERWVR